MSEWICPLCKLPESQHDKKVEEERKAANEARLARGERGIPKIPDSPDTRHAQAQPPSLALIAQRLVDLETKWQGSATWTTEDAAEWQDAINDLKTAARPAEQPAPPQSALEYARTVDVLTAPLDENDLAQPSAPPQPAADLCEKEHPFSSFVCPKGTTGCKQKHRAAEPSVEARQLSRLAKASRAILPLVIFWTKREIEKPANGDEMCRDRAQELREFRAALEQIEEQQNG